MVSVRAGAVRGWVRGLAWAVLLSGCSVYDESLLESEPVSDGDVVGTTTTDGTGGGSPTTGAGGGGTETTGNSSGGGDTSTSGADTTTDTVTTTTATTTSGTGGTTTTDAGGTGSGGTGADGTGGGSVGSGGVGGTGGSGGAGGNGGSGGDCTTGCADLCPNDANKTDPGVCGCGVPDEGSSGCVDLVTSLEHRYSFDDSGAQASDSAGQSDGTVVNTTLDGSGALALAGSDSDEYLELPAGIMSALQNVTVEVWFTWSGGNNWQRVFDFGNSDVGQGEQGVGDTYFFLTPKTSTNSVLQLTFTPGGFSGEVLVEAAQPAPADVPVHAAAVVDDTNDTLSLYIDGALEGSVAFTDALSDLMDVNNWIGRSQYGADDEFGGSIDEFRIYSMALSATQIELSYTSGPDPDFLQ